MSITKILGTSKLSIFNLYRLLILAREGTSRLDDSEMITVLNHYGEALQPKADPSLVRIPHSDCSSTPRLHGSET